MPRQKTDPAVLTRLAALLGKVARLGVRPDEVLDRANVPVGRMAGLDARLAEVRRSHLTAIYSEAIMAIGRQSSRADRKPHMHPDEFRLMCHCVISCLTLRDVLARQMMFFHTRADKIAEIAVREKGGDAIVEIDTLRRNRSFGGFLSDLAGMAIYSRLYSWLIAAGPGQFSVQLCYDTSFAEEPVEEFFGGPLRFGASVNAVIFPRILLDMPIVQTPRSLSGLLETFPFDFLAGSAASVPLIQRITTIYTTALEQGRRLPSLPMIAEMTGQSVPTLQRRLKAAGTGAFQLKEQARMGVAVACLEETAMAMEDIAARAGFRDGESFRNAFRRFAGMNPAMFRKAMDRPMIPPSYRRLQAHDLSVT